MAYVQSAYPSLFFVDTNKENIIKMQANWFVTFSAKVLHRTICVDFGSKRRLQFDRQVALWRNYWLRIQPNAKTVCEAARCNTTNHFRSSTRHEKDFERRELGFLWNCRTTRFFRYKTHHNEPRTVIFFRSIQHGLSVIRKRENTRHPFQVELINRLKDGLKS